MLQGGLGPLPCSPSALALLGWAGNEIAVSGAGCGGGCSHSLRQTHSSVRLIGPEWRHKRPPMDTLRLVIKLQAFVLLSVAFSPSPLPACLGSPPPHTHPSLPWGQPIHLGGPWTQATTADGAKRMRPPSSPSWQAFMPWPWDGPSSSWLQSDLTLRSGFLIP